MCCAVTQNALFAVRQGLRTAGVVLTLFSGSASRLEESQISTEPNSVTLSLLCPRSQRMHNANTEPELNRGPALAERSTC